MNTDQFLRHVIIDSTLSQNKFDVFFASQVRIGHCQLLFLSKKGGMLQDVISRPTRDM